MSARCSRCNDFCGDSCQRCPVCGDWCNSDHVCKVANASEVDLLDYLIEVAQKTEGAEVWRALFAEIKGRKKG